MSCVPEEKEKVSGTARVGGGSRQRAEIRLQAAPPAGSRQGSASGTHLMVSLAMAVRSYSQILYAILSMWLSQHGVPRWIQSILAAGSLLRAGQQTSSPSHDRKRCRYGFYRHLGNLQEGPPKLTVVLDLDDTLVCSFRKEVTPYRLLHGLGTNSHLRCHEIPCGPGGEIPASAPGSLMVFERPGLVEFLWELKTFAEVVLFTAGTEEYAAPVLQRLDPSREIFDAVLFRDSTVVTEGMGNIKDLGIVNRPLSSTVLVDNSPFSFLPQPHNGIPALPFSGSPTDKHLLGVLLPLLRDLSELDDVRPVLAHKYMLDHYLRNHSQMDGTGRQ